jgi:hypothetical protein
MRPAVGATGESDCAISGVEEKELPAHRAEGRIIVQGQRTVDVVVDTV